ncbi:hypothetical protein GA0115255_126603 [Streptomyces sp. Ncost-T6T-2b]|nr:hypothetical protein GA0115255_126603 [Streptomyces sp. Ncost-T6T-2b]
MTDRDRPEPRPRSAPQEPDPAVPRGDRETAPPAVPPPLGRRRGPAITVQLNTRVDPEVDSLVAHVGDVRGWSKRETVENALRLAYGKELQELRERASKEAS